MDDNKIDWFRDRLKEWAEFNLRDFPWRRTSDPYAILIAEFLLQKTSAQTVLPIYEAFVRTYPDLKTLADASVAEIGKLLTHLTRMSEKASGTATQQMPASVPECTTSI